VPLRAKTPRDAFRTFQDHLNGVLNKVLTHYRLRFVIRHTKQEQTSLSFFDDQREPVAVPLPPSPWYLFLGQRLQAVPERRRYILRTLEYKYRIQLVSSTQEEAVVRFEYVSRDVDPLARWCRHHVQFHRDYRGAPGNLSLSKHHVPTGWVTIEEVIRFLITDLGVPPLTDRWDEELRRSEEQFREWTGREVPE